MNALKRWRSPRAARLTCRSPRAAFSSIPPGSMSRSSITRVSRGPSSWKVTTPVWLIPCSTFHLTRSSGRWVSILAANSFFLPQILVEKATEDSLFWVTPVTRCMKLGHSSYCVHWL